MPNMATPFFKDGRRYPTPRELEAACDDFAEHLSNGLELPEIASRMEITLGTACVLLGTICNRLGAQAI